MDASGADASGARPTSSVRPRWAWARRALTAGALGAFAWAFIEPRWVETTHHEVALRVEAPLTLVHLSDLHSRGLGGVEERVLAIVEAARPDAIVITCDVVDNGALEPMRPFFARLSAPLGVWVVTGNWEHWVATEPQREFYRSVGARYLENEGAELRPGVFLAGVDDPASGRPDLERALRGAKPGDLRLVLTHAPALAEAWAATADLVLAGHTHGGQVRVPFLGPPWTPPGSGRFVAGWYTLGRARLFVSRGVGTSILPVRFACRPEVAVLRVVPGG